MAWEQRGNHRYYYRGVCQDGRVKKIYCGGGFAGLAALDADIRRREERQAQLLAWLTFRRRLDEIETLSRQLQERCDLLAQAILLASGFHRLNRFPWCRWHAAWRAARSSARTCCPRRATHARGPSQKR
jgi:hypothetical protein